MIPLHFVGDGQRDEAMVPLFVEAILGQPIRAEFRPWSRLHGAGRGYDKKLLYAVLQAKDENACGLIATIDADKDGKQRIDPLRAGRESHRQKYPEIAIAVGCADPNHEAWLMDDQEAVRAALSIPHDQSIPKSKRPKEDLDKLIDEWMQGRDRIDLLKDITRQVRMERCHRRAETGYQAFVDDVRSEFASLLP